MADVVQVWQGYDQFGGCGLRYYVHQDFDEQPNIETAFDFITSIRLFGIQIGQCILKPLKNIDPLPLTWIAGVQLGTVDSKLDDWQGYKDDVAAAWTAGGLTEARFLLTLIIDITVPFLFHPKIKITVAHKPVSIPLHWDDASKKYAKPAGGIDFVKLQALLAQT